MKIEIFRARKLVRFLPTPTPTPTPSIDIESTPTPATPTDSYRVFILISFLELQWATAGKGYEP